MEDKGGKQKLKKELGLWATTAIVIGQMLGTGIFMGDLLHSKLD